MDWSVNVFFTISTFITAGQNVTPLLCIITSSISTRQTGLTPLPWLNTNTALTNSIETVTRATAKLISIRTSHSCHSSSKNFIPRQLNLDTSYYNIPTTNEFRLPVFNIFETEMLITQTIDTKRHLNATAWPLDVILITCFIVGHMVEYKHCNTAPLGGVRCGFTEGFTHRRSTAYLQERVMHCSVHTSS